jgi:hypothetical protein
MYRTWILCEIWGFIVGADENCSRTVHDIVWIICDSLRMFRCGLVPLISCTTNFMVSVFLLPKTVEWFCKTFTTIYQAIRCHILKVINHYGHRCEAMHLTRPLLKLFDKMRTEGWCSCGEFTSHRYKSEDWNLYNDAVFIGKELQKFIGFIYLFLKVFDYSGSVKSPPKLR